MPSAFSHAISAVAIGKLFKKENNFKFLLIGALCSVLPDIDAIGFHYGIQYSSLFGHRGFTHSFFFAALIAFLLIFFFRKSSVNKYILFLYFFFATALHPILDAFTSGGLGVAFFSPFSNERYFFPWRPIKVSPISISGFFTERGWQVFKSEFIWIWIPSLVIIILRRKSR